MFINLNRSIFEFIIRNSIWFSSDALRYSFSLSSMFSRGFALGSDENDVVVIGGGPGGYVAAIKAAQLGSKLLVLRSVALLASTSVASLLSYLEEEWKERNQGI
ncbi:hypothetical protein L1887_41811 [Cichorium endivia]|nr:hypothetical protein L1887_41811 [Cichorium endivia]